LPIKTLFLLTFLFAAAFCGAISVEYRNGDTEKIKKAAFKEKTYFLTKGRSVEINLKKLNGMDVISDAIEIYYGDTWVRANVYPTTKDTANIPVYEGWIKINTILTGVAEFGKISSAISELKHIKVNTPKQKSKKSPKQVPTIAVANNGGEKGSEAAGENAGENLTVNENLTDNEGENKDEQE
jgi:hypothetical protein